MDQSYIEHTSGGTMFAGPDAVALYRATCIIHALKACKIGMRLTRTATPSAMLKAAGELCGKTYKRGQYDAAIADVTIWRDTMRCALHVIK